MTLVVIGFGSNVGDRAVHLREAKRALIAAGLEWVGESSVLESAPFGHAPDDSAALWYLNAVACVETTESPEYLVELFQALETRAGRNVDDRRGGAFYRSRPLDLDLLFYGEAVVQRANLVVPHPSVAHRRFVLQPLSELLPDWIHPTLHRSMRHLLDACEDTTEVRPFASSFDVL